MKRICVLIIVVCIIISVFTTGCKDSITQDDTTPCDSTTFDSTGYDTTHGDEVVYMSLDGDHNTVGVYVLDPYEFTFIDSFKTPYTPASTVFSPDFATWYIHTYNEPEPYIYQQEIWYVDGITKSVAAVEPYDRFVDFDISLDGEFLFLNNDQTYDLRMVDTQTREVVHQDTTMELRRIVSSPIRTVVYGVGRYRLPDGTITIRVGAYDYVEKVWIWLEPYNTEELMAAFYWGYSWSFVVSPDDKHLFMRCSNGFGVGYFYNIDTEYGEVLYSTSTNTWHDLAVSPDGRHVYFTDPGEALIFTDTPINGWLWRYDVLCREIVPYISIADLNPDCIPGLLTSERMVVLSDNRTGIISGGWNKCWENSNVDIYKRIFKVDLESKELLEAIRMPHHLSNYALSMTKGERPQ
ncbi:MAG: hypothetical protein ACE5EE_06970 [Fidelibacterota bacterium]